MYSVSVKPTFFATPAAFRAWLKKHHKNADAANPKAWSVFREQPPSYRRLVTGWVGGAPQEATRLRRLDKLMAACESGRRL